MPSMQQHHITPHAFGVQINSLNRHGTAENHSSVPRSSTSMPLPSRSVLANPRIVSVPVSCLRRYLDKP